MRYRIVDVFTQTPLEGNPLAVFPEPGELSTERMQQIAREMNLSESVFLFPPERAGSLRRLRIFTPTREMEFAGHPTVGTSWLLLDEGIATGSAFVLDLNIGAVPIRVESGNMPGLTMPWLTMPPVKEGPLVDAAQCAAALGLSIADLLPYPPQELSAGNSTLVIGLRDQATVDRSFLSQRVGPPGVCVYVFTPSEAGVYGRMFAPDHGVIEDPATGSSMGPLAAFLLKHSLTKEGSKWICEQGTKMGRRSLLHVWVESAAHIEVGGHAVGVARGELSV